MSEFKHVALNKSVLDLLVGPSDEQFVVVVGLGSESRGEVDGYGEILAFPVRF